MSEIFRKGTLLMNRFGFAAVLSADTVEHVRAIAVSDYRKNREEQLLVLMSQLLISDRQAAF